jgi:hypothetical protein
MRINGDVDKGLLSFYALTLIGLADGGSTGPSEVSR